MPLGTPESSPQVLATTEPEMQNGLDLYRFDSPETAGRWAIVNDGVMGGVSESSLALGEEGALLFSGTVSLENNGGFASVRSVPSDYGITDEKGIRLVVRGDGKMYRLRLYAGDRSAVAYETPFQTIANEWQTINMPFAEFVPRVRGRVLTGYEPLEPASVEAVGMIISDYQAGDFALEVASIEAYR
jgi:hypothetical protein